MAKKATSPEVARELARRTRQALRGGSLPGGGEHPSFNDGCALTNPAPAPSSSVYVPPPVAHEKIRMDTLYDAVVKANDALPGMVDDLIAEFHRKRTLKSGEEIPFYKVTTRRHIFETLAKFALTDKRLEQAMGMLRNAAGDNGIPLAQLFNINILQIPNRDTRVVDAELRRIAGGSG